MNASTPRVTIAIPTYNRVASYLPQSLACAVGQTYRNIEIIVSDNCSRDGTPEFMRRQIDPRLRYYRQQRPTTPNANFNFCVQQARGDYFLLLLDDELIDRNFVERCMAAVNHERDIGIIRSGLRVIDAHGACLHQIDNGASGLSLSDLFLAWIDGRTALYLCNTLFALAPLRAIGGFGSRHNLFQDVIAQVRVAAAAGRVDIRDVLASTRSHPGQFTYSANVYGWAEDAQDLLELMLSIAEEKQEVIRERGMKFFANICYSRAGMIGSPWERLRAYGRLYSMFQYRCLPSMRLVASSTAMYRALRTIKRRIKGQPKWAAAG